MPNNIYSDSGRDFRVIYSAINFGCYLRKVAMFQANKYPRATA
jgi:hypothetical protein